MSTHQEQPHIQLLMLSRGYVLSRAIQTVASLGLADHMSETPVDVHLLANKTNTKPLLLERLLDFLASYGLFEKNAQGFSLTALSKPLQSRDPHSVKDTINMVDNIWWEAFAYMDQGLKTGNPPFNHAHHQDFFDFLQSHPEKQQNFDRGMAKLSSYEDDRIANACDLEKFNSVMDIGGGKGGLVRALAKRFPELMLTLFETPAVIDPLNPADFPANIILKTGNFLEDIPYADAYICRGVLHDFNDELVMKILHNCRQTMHKDNSLFIIEQVIPDITGPHPNKTMDIVMMVLLGGRQRTLENWQSLLKTAGFSLYGVTPTESLFTVMEFKIAD